MFFAEKFYKVEIFLLKPIYKKQAATTIHNGYEGLIVSISYSRKDPLSRIVKQRD